MVFALSFPIIGMKLARASSSALGFGAPPAADLGRALCNASLSAGVSFLGLGLPIVEFQSRGFAFNRSSRVRYDGSSIFNAFSASELRWIDVMLTLSEVACAKPDVDAKSGEEKKTHATASLDTSSLTSENSEQ